MPKKIVPFLLKLTKGKGIRIEDRTVSGHSLEDLKNFPKNTEGKRTSFSFFRGEMISSKNILKFTDVLGKLKKSVLQNASLTLYLQYKNYMRISRKS